MIRKASTPGTPQLFVEPSETELRRFTPLPEFDGVPAWLLDIPETIPQLGYASHQYFRYYGKFPSIVGREIMRRFVRSGDRVLDCYAGSGTTLVEAQIAGCPSYGVDINPLGVLACNVKTSYFDRSAIRHTLRAITQSADREAPWLPAAQGPEKLRKWFRPDAIEGLGRLRSAIEAIAPGRERMFLLTAFLAIVRRCSNAYDGEVRPHVNPSKRARAPVPAFVDKVEDMLRGLDELDQMRPRDVIARSAIGDNREVSTYSQCESEPIDLVVAHPPYLNSFNYLQVFSLEFMWAEDLEDVWQGWQPPEVRNLEHRAWPATNDEVRSSYYEAFYAAIKASSAVLRPGGVLAVVIGDATIRKRLEPVHRIFWDELKRMGFDPLEIWYRTTHYGIGKYAYRHRADYHGAAEKRDAVMFFRKPG